MSVARRGSSGHLCIARRGLLAGLGGIAVAGAVGCGGRPKTPLAHLYGQAWVVGAYEYYGEEYADLERSTQRASFDAYRVLAQRGVTALDGLQQREVPFYIRASAASFRIERDVPERLTFTAEMSEEDRELATEAWELAREAIHTDYEEIQRLDAALTQLLGQLQRVQSAWLASREEQFRRVYQLEQLAGDGEVPFELPFEVNKGDYQNVLWLLLDRLEHEKERLAELEGAMISVGLLCRATDAGSGSLAANIRKVLLAVDADAKAAGDLDIRYPEDEATRTKRMSRGQQLYGEIRATPEYQAFRERERDEALLQVGALFAVIDQFTGLSTSTMFLTSMKIFSGDADYFDYLKLAASVAPHGGTVASTLETAVELTGQLRTVTRGAQTALDIASSDAPHAELGSLVVNAGTRFARDKIDRQIVVFEDATEVVRTEEALLASGLLSGL